MARAKPRGRVRYKQGTGKQKQWSFRVISPSQGKTTSSGRGYDTLEAAKKGVRATRDILNNRPREEVVD